MVLPVGEALVHLDGGQSLQDRGAEVKQGGGAVVGRILQGQKASERWGPGHGREGSRGRAGPACTPVPARRGFGAPHPPIATPPAPSSRTV